MNADWFTTKYLSPYISPSGGSIALYHKLLNLTTLRSIPANLAFLHTVLIELICWMVLALTDPLTAKDVLVHCLG